MKGIQKANEISARLKRGHVWKSGNLLQLEAERNSLEITNQEDLLKMDMTEMFLREIRREVTLNEIVKIVINGKMRLGKSTIAILIGRYIHDILKETKKEHTKGKEFSIWNIARDEQEYLTRMRDPSLMYDVIVVDERNAMDETGENATVEAKQKEMFSDIQAGRYIHTVMVTPEKDVDDNNDIKLVVRERDGGLSHCRLYYRLNKGPYSRWELLGHVNLNVLSLIKNWVKVESRFMKYIRGEFKDENERQSDLKFIKYWRDKDFYVNYMYRKYEKMELMNKEGVQRERELDYAEIMLNVVEELKDMVLIMNTTSLRRMVSNYVEIGFKEAKIPYSMIGLDRTSERVMSVISLYKTLNEVKEKLNKLRERKRKSKIGEEAFEKDALKLKNIGNKIVKSINYQLDEWGRYSELNRKYNDIK